MDTISHNAATIDSVNVLLQNTHISHQGPANVTLVHEPRMQAHAPPMYDGGVKEIPQRIVAIESVLRGYSFDSLDAAAPVVSVTSDRLSDKEWGRCSPLVGGMKGTTVKENARKKADLPLEELFDASVAAPNSVAQQNAALDANWKPTQHAQSMEGSLWRQCRIVHCPVAPLQWLTLVHSEKHLKALVRKVLIARFGSVSFIDKDCADLCKALSYSLSCVQNSLNHVLSHSIDVSPGTFEAARLAAGGAVAAVQSLFDSTMQKSRASFAIVRPPGHHCTAEKPAGFCFLSNTAIAARYGLN
jgi:hypothetical protein